MSDINSNYHRFDIKEKCSSFELITPNTSSKSDKIPKLGIHARHELRKLLQNTTDPYNSIISFQINNSLHSHLLNCFATKPQYECHRKDDLNMTCASSGDCNLITTCSKIVSGTEDSKNMLEIFNPESALTFLGYFGVTRYEIHRKISDSLRLAMEDEINRIDLDSNRGYECLLKLLKCSFPYHGMADIQPLVVALIRKLGERTPTDIFILLATKRKDEGGKLVYDELLKGVGLNIERLIWEADWYNVVRGDGLPNKNLLVKIERDINIGSMRSNNLLANVVRGIVEEYITDESLKEIANLSFIANDRVKSNFYRNRRIYGHLKVNCFGTTNSYAINSALPSLAISPLLSSLEKTSEGEKILKYTSKDMVMTSSSQSLISLTNVIGSRPKILNAILNMFISEHGLMTSNKILMGGDSFLICTLTSDVIISYGKLPQQYEHISILANILDNCVKTGFVSDQAIAQIQGCLRATFQKDLPNQENMKDCRINPDDFKSVVHVISNIHEKEKKSISDSSSMQQSTNSSGNVHKATSSECDKSRKFKINKIIKSAVNAMKSVDTQDTFFNPVTDDIAPGYSSIIKNPMSISVIEKKCNYQEYQSLGEYIADVKQIFENCLTFNVGTKGKWYRTEASRQKKIWTEEILKRAYNLYKKTFPKVKTLENANIFLNNTGCHHGNENIINIDEVAEGSLFGQQERHVNCLPSSMLSRTNIHRTVYHDNYHAIDKLTANDVFPLPESRAKKRKIENEFPSMPALAAMLLSDPFAIPLFLDKLYFAVREVVLIDRSIPFLHKVIPSILQILHVSLFSTEFCALKGKKFFIFDSGLNESPIGDPFSDLPFTSLRIYVPFMAKILLEAELDRRMMVGGNLKDVASNSSLHRSAQSANELTGTSSLPILLSLVEYALVNLLVSVKPSDYSLLTIQYPRFVEALDKLSNGNISDERQFFLSLIYVLVKHNTNLSPKVRDLVVSNWFRWFKVPEGISCMVSAVHECFIRLLNEMANMNDVIMPRELLLDLTRDAAHAVEVHRNGDHISFSEYWRENDSKFSPIKAQYIRMLKLVPLRRANQWKNSLGIE